MPLLSRTVLTAFLLCCLTDYVSAQCRSGEIGGTVFRDYNSDGHYDPTEEPGIAGVEVLASQGDSVLARTFTDFTGAYQLPVADGTTVLLEFRGIPLYLRPGFLGVDSQSTIQRRVSPDCRSHLGLQDPGEYCPSPAQIASTRFVAGGQFTGPFGDTPAIVGVSENGGSNSTNLAEYASPAFDVLATARDVGATFGLAYRSETDVVYAGAFIRRHAGLGPTLNPTTIYSIDRRSGVSAPWLTIDPSRQDPHTGQNDGDPLWPRDFGAYAAVFKEGIGDLEISHDGRTLFAVDLGTRKLVEIEITAAGTPGTLTSHDIVPLVADATLQSQCTTPQGNFASQDVRPFGLGYHNGELYLGIVCSAQSTVNEATELPIEGAREPDDWVIPCPPIQSMRLE